MMLSDVHGRTIGLGDERLECFVSTLAILRFGEIFGGEGDETFGAGRVLSLLLADG
jgi:hypothetical protein